MFNNIGGKIKSLAKISAYIGILGSIVVGVLFFVLGIISFNPLLVVFAFVIGLGGSLCSWMSVFLFYGFGELIDKATEIADNTKHIEKRSKGNDLYENVETYEPTFKDCIDDTIV